MRPIIEFCNSNMALGTDVIMKRLEENSDYDVIEYGCLGNCGQCYMTPFAMVNGEIITAGTPDELYDNILAWINTPDDGFAWLDDMD
ncbi:MAG: YuzB family protein [Paenibacillaceae bacterium]